LREDFLDKLLRQDVAHFDKDGSGSAATQVTTSEKPAQANFLSVLLMVWNRRQQNQSRHSGEAVYLRPRHLTLFLRLHRSTGGSMEACSDRNEYYSCHLLDHRSVHWHGCAH
jgi:hypothetical protein